ncbi:MAG: septum formation initiator family protein [Bacteroidetes bacterium]|nr:septum formation initiator family protein [Bacteroidota bacterium]
MDGKRRYGIEGYIDRAYDEVDTGTTQEVSGRIDGVAEGVRTPFLERKYSNPISHTVRVPKRKSISPFAVVVALFVAAILIVLYINNIITVNHLMREISVLESKHQRLVNDQEILRARIHKLSSFDRVQRIAQSNRGLTFPKEAPQVLLVDPERLYEAKRLLNRMEGTITKE